MMSRLTRYNFCESSFLYNNLQSYKDKVLVLDTRDADSYLCQALSNSISLSFDTIDSYLKEQKDNADIQDLSLSDVASMICQKDIERWNLRKRFYCILIVSEESLPEELISKTRKIARVDELGDNYTVPSKDIEPDLNRYNEVIKEKNAFMIGRKLFSLLAEDRVRELYIFVNGTERFFDRYPFMDPWFHPSPQSFVRSASLIATKLDITYNFPSDIWGGRLFLGSYNQASQYVIVQALNITHVVNVTAECTNVHEARGIKYLHIVILDEKDVDVLKFFKDAYDFIDEALSSGPDSKVLLHCALGKSRSATITAMFLMKKFSWTAEKALEYVKNRRRIVDPNYGFVMQLEQFEKSHFSFAELEKSKNVN